MPEHILKKSYHTYLFEKKSNTCNLSLIIVEYRYKTIMILIKYLIIQLGLFRYCRIGLGP